ncbi:SDR family NAD(P)-dependent oxidoreductase [Bradyrhizobium sp. ISRA443]|uniref:SDR family NAD(P)-dependent oxidoreductase n=1 Tax=unclassified Bradyrhizobium TaxID=2631580 RepID=UPI0032AF075F
MAIRRSQSGATSSTRPPWPQRSTGSLPSSGSWTLQNNAGVHSPATETTDVSGEEFNRVTVIHFRGIWTCMKLELRHMREQGSGAIVNCSSIGGLIGLPGRSAYHAAKHGVFALTKSSVLDTPPEESGSTQCVRARSILPWFRKCSPRNQKR